MPPSRTPASLSGLGGRTTCPRTLNAGQMFTLSRIPTARKRDPGARANFRFTKPEIEANGPKRPRPGDVFVFESKTGRQLAKDYKDLTGSTKIETFAGHTGIVRSYDPAGKKLHTIEGNADKGNSTDGVGVFEKSNSLQNPRLFGFARPKVDFG